MAGSLASPLTEQSRKWVLELELLKPGQKERPKQLTEKDAKNVGIWYLVGEKKKKKNPGSKVKTTLRVLTHLR